MSFWGPLTHGKFPNVIGLNLKTIILKMIILSLFFLSCVNTAALTTTPNTHKLTFLQEIIEMLREVF